MESLDLMISKFTILKAVLIKVFNACDKQNKILTLNSHWWSMVTQNAQVSVFERIGF